MSYFEKKNSTKDWMKLEGQGDLWTIISSTHFFFFVQLHNAWLNNEAHMLLKMLWCVW